jgi:hypothetical protein
MAPSESVALLTEYLHDTEVEPLRGELRANKMSAREVSAREMSARKKSARKLKTLLFLFIFKLAFLSLSFDLDSHLALLAL